MVVTQPGTNVQFVPCIGKSNPNKLNYYYAIRWKTWFKTLMKGVASYEMLRRGACSL